MNMKYCLLAILLLFSLNTVCAADTVCQKLTLDESISIAVAKNLDINKRRKDYDIATNNIKVADRLQDTRFETFFLVGDTSVGNPEMLGFVQPIEIMKRGARKSAAQSQRTLTSTSINSDIFDLKMDVRTAYIMYASSKSIVKIIERQQQYLKEMVTIASRRVFVGVAAEVEYMQAKIILDQLNTTYNQALTQVEVSQYNFNRTINSEENNLVYDIVDAELPQNVDFIKLSTPNPKSQLPSLDEVENIALQNRNDIKIAKNEIEVARKQLIVVIRKKVPDVEVLAGYMFLTPHQNNDFTVSDGGFAQGAYMGLNINVPLLYRYKPEIQNAKIELEKKQLNLMSVQNKAKQSVKIAYSRLLVAQKNLNYYSDELLKSSANVVKSSRRSYEVGKSQLSDLIIMQQANMNILMGYTIALVAYYSAWIDLLRELSVEVIS